MWLVAAILGTRGELCFVQWIDSFISFESGRPVSLALHRNLTLENQQHMHLDEEGEGEVLVSVIPLTAEFLAKCRY